jgi:archaeosine synthase beta-subunit
VAVGAVAGVRRSFPVTAAGPRRICTVFPILRAKRRASRDTLRVQSQHFTTARPLVNWMPTPSQLQGADRLATMTHMPFPALSSRDITAARPPKNTVDPRRPYAFFVERERAHSGEIVDVATIFLTNRECPWRCLMCDLWKNTTDASVPPGAIAEQIDHALGRLPPARQVKLYNSGNFFDRRAVPAEDHGQIADRVRRFERVIVENHPLLVSDACGQFRDLLGTRLEVAMGLETVHPEVLPRLNKAMTLTDFARAAEWLLENAIDVRVFILLRPPFLTEDEGVEWAVRSLEYAFSLGVGCAAVIPTRGGNGIMESLATAGHYAPPRLSSLEQTLEAGLALGRGRVFVDLWDAERFSDCPACGPARVERLNRMNLCQRIEPRADCDRCRKEAK